jgi:hypothetical protein
VRLIGEGDATPDVPETPEGGEGGEGSSSEAAGGEGWTEWMRWCASRKQLRELSSEAGSALGQKVVELRLSLHLNLAAAALRLDDWELAVRLTTAIQTQPRGAACDATRATRPDAA